MLARASALLLVLTACAQGTAETRRPGGDYLVSLLPTGNPVSEGWARKRPPRLSQGVESYYVRASDGAWFIVFSAPAEPGEPLDKALNDAMAKNTLFAIQLEGYPIGQDVTAEAAQAPAPLTGVDGEGEEGLYKLDKPPMRFYAAVARNKGRQVFVIAGSHQQGEAGADEARDFLRRVRFKG